MGLEPTTPRSTVKPGAVVSGPHKGLASTPSAACTSACTSEAENANAGALDAASLGTSPQAAGKLDTDQGTEGEANADKPADALAALAAVIAGLSSADRERLVAMLTGHQGVGG